MIVVLVIFGLFCLFARLICKREDEKNDIQYKAVQRTTDVRNVSYDNVSFERITSVDQMREAKQAYEFKKKVDYLRERIKDNIRMLETDKNPEMRGINSFMRSELEKLLAIPIRNEYDLECLAWRYNNGELRTDSEILHREQYKRNSEYVSSGAFEKACNRRSYKLPWLLFFIGWLPVVIYFMVAEGGTMFEFVVGAVLGVFPGGILALIGCAIGESINKRDAEDLMRQGVHEAAPMVKRASRNLKVTAAASAAAAAGIVHTTKKAAKDIANVDSWKQMK